MKNAASNVRGIKISSSLKAGGISPQHNRALMVRSAIKAGGISAQHNRALRVA
jgi:hypothetical protein